MRYVERSNKTLMYVKPKRRIAINKRTRKMYIGDIKIVFRLQVIGNERKK